MHSTKSVPLTSKNSPGSLKFLLLACRPKTLSASITPVVVGAALAYHLGFRVELGIFFCTLFSALLIQVGTNLFNDALDFEKGADSHTRLGPLRATHMGWFTARQVKGAAVFCFLIAAIVAVPLVLRGGWPIVIVGVVSFSLGYLYTGGPRPLAYTGLGDLFVILFFGVVAVMGTDYLLTNRWLPDAFVAGIEVGALATVLLAINNFRDMIPDRAIGKMTLPARFGAAFARSEIAALFGIAFGLLAYWPNERFLLLLFAPSLILALVVILRVARAEPSEQMNRLLHLAALAQMTFGGALAILLLCNRAVI
jgi:1,4-dihydroxy-2-naphthoate octaprenyltransferase